MDSILNEHYLYASQHSVWIKYEHVDKSSLYGVDKGISTWTW